MLNSSVHATNSSEFSNPEEYKKAVMTASLLRHEFTGGEVMDIYVCNEFKISVKNFTVMSEAEEGNIFKMEVTMNPPAAPEASTAPP